MQEFETRLKKTVDVIKEKFGSVRTGRADPNLLNTVVVDYYGSQVPIQQLGAISVVEGNTFVVNVYDHSSVSAIEKAIQISNLGLTPNIDGGVIRMKLPDLTEERREELVKVARKMAEEGKVSLRNIRRDSLDQIKNDGHSEDEEKQANDEIQKLTDLRSYQILVDLLVLQ